MRKSLLQSIRYPFCNSVLRAASSSSRSSFRVCIVGAGENGIIAEDKPESIDFRLVFHKPWKSVAAVRFELNYVLSSVDGSSSARVSLARCEWDAMYSLSVSYTGVLVQLGGWWRNRQVHRQFGEPRRYRFHSAHQYARQRQAFGCHFHVRC